VTTTIDPTAPRASRLRRPGRPGRAVLLLIAALAVAAASWTIGPALAGLGRPAAPADAGRTVPLPGNVAALGDAPGAGTGAVGPTADDRLPLADRRSFWAARVAARPADFLSLTQLALVEAETARSTADLGAYQRAAALIDRALAEVPAYPPTIRARGGIRFALHDFGGARADADQVLRATPDDPAALALLGDAAIELGDLDAADAAYATLATVAPGPWLDVRRARLASARGDHAGAVALARLAAADAAASDPAEAAFYAYAVGEYARLAGDAETARAGFERALAAWPDDLGALIGLARVDAAAGELDAAIGRLRRAAAIAPQPETVALLGDVLAARGDAVGAREQADTLRFLATLDETQGRVNDRVLLRHALDHDGDAAAVLALAGAGLAERPDAAGHDLVAWALHRLGRDAEALDAIAAARASGADDARLDFHEGAIRLALGDPAGRSLIQEAVDRGPALDPVERAEALALLEG
jgi:tetratricopeptide (TPR) repeat protein